MNILSIEAGLSVAAGLKPAATFVRFFYIFYDGTVFAYIERYFVPVCMVSF